MKVKIVNVFSINNQGGNSCAIVDNAAHLSTDEMQAAQDKEAMEDQLKKS